MVKPLMSWQRLTPVLFSACSNKKYGDNTVVYHQKQQTSRGVKIIFTGLTTWLWLCAGVVVLFMLFSAGKHGGRHSRLKGIRATILLSSQQVQPAAYLQGLRQENWSPDLIHIMVLIGTRPEAVKMAPVLLELKRRPDRFHCILVSTGQHKEMLHQVLDLFGLAGSVDTSLDLMVADQTLPDLTARVMIGMQEVFRAFTPDMLLVQGDTTSAFIGALAAYYFKVPVGHVEAGLRTNDIYSPFPEEINRQGIGLVASLNFAATHAAANNLLAESKVPGSIFITGNPVADALRSFAINAHSMVMDAVHKQVAARCGGAQCRVILLTAHRRENHGVPLKDIVNAAVDILAAHPDVIIVYPVHLNPRVRETIQQVLPGHPFLTSVQPGSRALPVPAGATHTAGGRLLLLPPVDYQDLIQIMNASTCIMTDSGGIQEEGAILGKPILILRNTTERPEGVMAGVAKLVGTDRRSIVSAATNALNLGSAQTDIAKGLYGDGHAAEKIADIIHWYFGQRLAPPPIQSVDQSTAQYDMAVVVTVWKRATLQQYMEMLSTQSLLRRPGFRANVIIFQNGKHVDVSEIVQHWTTAGRNVWMGASVDVSYMQSIVATGYFGRFLVPLISRVREDGYFVVCDDDVLFGSHYFESMVRVVDSGNLAVRNGRFVVPKGDSGFEENFGASTHGWSQGMQVTAEVDITYDFGGHLWAGRMAWLKGAWSHPPVSLVTSEDFWLSAVLKVFYNIGTKRVRCPLSDMQSCACSMPDALDHKAVEVGSSIGGEALRERNTAITRIVQAYGYHPLNASHHQAEQQAYQFFKQGAGPFNTSGSLFASCFWWT